jgi:hypothetical protein
MASLFDIIGNMGRQRSQAAAGAGGLLMERPLENAALATMFTPVVGDVTGLLADAKMYAIEPEERKISNYALTALGVLPFFPAVATMKKVGKAKPKTKSEKIAQKVLNFLEKGKINKITADMLSQADDAYLAKNYDLPMDTESRLERAREMGFDLENVMYHGTDESFDVFDLKPSFSLQSKKPVYTTNNPNVAASYAHLRDGQIYPLVQRNDLDEVVVDAGGEFYSRIKPKSLASLKGGPEVFVEDLFGSDYGMLFSTDFLADKAYKSNVPRITFKNVVDRGPVSSTWHNLPEGSANVPSTVTANLSPSSLRSPFARFDPRLKDIENILAGVAPIAVVTPSVVRGLLDTEEER